MSGLGSPADASSTLAVKHAPCMRSHAANAGQSLKRGSH